MNKISYIFYYVVFWLFSWCISGFFWLFFTFIIIFICFCFRKTNNFFLNTTQCFIICLGIRWTKKSLQVFLANGLFYIISFSSNLSISSIDTLIGECVNFLVLGTGLCFLSFKSWYRYCFNKQVYHFFFLYFFVSVSFNSLKSFSSYKVWKCNILPLILHFSRYCLSVLSLFHFDLLHVV